MDTLWKGVQGPAGHGYMGEGWVAGHEHSREMWREGRA